MQSILHIAGISPNNNEFKTHLCKGVRVNRKNGVLSDSIFFVTSAGQFSVPQVVWHLQCYSNIGLIH